MKTRSSSHRALCSSLPLLLLASAAVAASSCGSVVETPAGTGGGSPGTTSGQNGTNGSSGNTSSSGVGPGPSDCSTPFGAFKSSSACQDCHESIYNDWKQSMHSRSITGPVFTAQSNQSFGLELKDLGSPDPQRVCVQCHSPISAAFAGKQVHLPFTQEGDVPACALEEGVGCVTCHAYTGLPAVGAAGFSDFLNDFDSSGFTYYGPFANPVDSPAHQSAVSPTLGVEPESLCITCHNVFVDTNLDGVITAGEDLILQNTTFEHDVLYLAQRDETCIDCHMPQKPTGAAADGPAAPAGVPKNRNRRSHGFVGADFPLDDLDNDTQLGLRTELLQSAAVLEVANIQLVGGSQLSFDVVITNVKAGHNLPTGFGFLRQMWVEARVLNTMSGLELASSGLLKKLSDDLCDNDTLNDSLQVQVQGCVVQNKNQADAQLVNFQTKLVTDVDPAVVNGVQVAVQAPGATETWAPLLGGGAVARTRQIDQQSLAPLAPFEVRSFAYGFTFPQQQDGIRVEVALKFRSLPPYFLRTLAQKEPVLAQKLTQNLGKLKPITMATFSQDL